MKEGLKALVTGASGAIGSAVALELARRGVDVALHYNTNVDKTKTLVDEIKSMGRNVSAIKANIADVRQIKDMVQTVVRDLGKLNLLVHCAATFNKSPFGEVTEEIFDKEMAINLKAAFFLSQEAARVMTDGGRMIFMSDVASAKPYTGYLPYCMAKSATETMVKALAKKFAPRICVNAIAPYMVTRPSFLSDAGFNDMISKTPARRLSPPEEIAALVIYLADASPSLTGQIIVVDGGRMLR